MSTRKAVAIDHVFRQWMTRLCIAVVALALLTGCGGGNLSPGENAQTLQVGSATITSSGSLQPPVTSGGAGTEVTGAAGANITSLKLVLPSSATGNPDALSPTKIAFTRNNQLYLMNADGSDPVQVAPGRDAFSPDWFPDGARLAFISTDASVGKKQIFTINPDGTGLKRLTDGAQIVTDLSVSRDGTQIAFSQHIGTEANHIFTISATGGTATPITSGTADDLHPTWSPDGARIAFERANVTDVAYHVYVMDANGANVHPLLGSTFDSYNTLDPSWAPNNNIIAFSLAGTIAYANADTAPNAAITKVTPDGGAAFKPDWSPDGSRLAYVDSQSNTSQIWTVEASGGNATRITANQANVKDDEPAWSPTLTTRILVGNNGIFGTKAAGFIIGLKSGVVTSVLTFNSTTPTSTRVTTTTGINGGLTTYLFTITAPQKLTSLVYQNDLFGSPTVVIDPAVPSNANAALVSYNAASGTVDAVILTNASVSTAAAPAISQNGSTVVVKGTFASVWDAAGANRAPQGATEVQLSSKTGVLLSVK